MDTENRTPEELWVEEDNKNLKKQKKKTGFFKGFLTGVISTLLVAGLCYIGINAAYFITLSRAGAQADSDSVEESVLSTETLQKIKTIEEMIGVYYYGDEVTGEELQDGIYKGMVAALDDPYSEYYTIEELEDVMATNEGISYGIGAYISLHQTMEMPMISGVMEDSPAQAAGLREGDIIHEVNGESTQGYSLSKVVSLVKGEENTPVVLTIYREGEPDFLEIEAIRGKLIETETVQAAILEDTDNIGYLSISEFDGVTIDQFNEAMAELRANDMKGLILDLRSNPGGDLTAVVEVARRLLPEGLITYTEDKYGNRKEYKCDGEYEIEIPMVVLVNEYSASASELLAGAIKDYNKGTLIGTTTYGKGIVQRINQLEDGTAIKLTVSAYFTPNGINIHGTGVEPDIELEYDYELAESEGVDNQVEKAIEVLEEKMAE